MGDLESFVNATWPALVWISTSVLYLASFVVVVAVLRRRDEPMAMLAWILALVLLPVAGLLLYFLLGAPRIERRRKKRRRRGGTISTPSARRREGRDVGAIPGIPAAVEPGLRELARLSSTFGAYSLTHGNRVKVFQESAEIYDDLLASIDAAKDHVHLEYYIFRDDDTGRLFRDRLARKAADGVEVRILVDGIGSWGTRRRFFRPVVESGGKVAVFLPAVPLRRKWNINYRNHRKIAVIDGRTAYTGSQNVGDEYRGRWRRVERWKDTHLRIEGPASADLQEVFLADWAFASEERLPESRYLVDPAPCGESLVQIVPSGPDSPRDLLQEYVFLAIALARKRIRISTPYFVPGAELLVALKTAARLDVPVDLLIPAKTDSTFVLWAGRSYYHELLAAGVRIHEHPYAMLHSKLVLIDDHWALVGSANMDMRSFWTNFEVTATVFDSEICRQLAAAFDKDCSDAVAITRWPPPEQSLFEAALEGAARLCSPLL